MQLQPLVPTKEPKTDTGEMIAFSQLELGNLDVHMQKVKIRNAVFHSFIM